MNHAGTNDGEDDSRVAELTGICVAFVMALTSGIDAAELGMLMFTWLTNGMLGIVPGTAYGMFHELFCAAFITKLDGMALDEAATCGI